MSTELGRTETEEMRDLARSVGETLEAESNFDPSEWEPGDDIPSDIEYNLEQGWDLSSTIGIDEDEALDAMREALETAMEQWRETANESVLDVRAEVSLGYGGLTVNHVTIVLGTGGPHVEVTLQDDGRGYVTAYGWFRAGESTYPISISGHPLMAIVEDAIDTLERER